MIVQVTCTRLQAVVMSVQRHRHRLKGLAIKGSPPTEDEVHSQLQRENREQTNKSASLALDAHCTRSVPVC
jgi:hypothetical protein